MNNKDGLILSLGEDTGLEADEIRGLKEDIKYLKEKLKKQNHDLNYASDKIIKLLDDKCYWKREALKWANEIGEQIPKKPQEVDVDFSTFVCPNCLSTIMHTDEKETHNYCLKCGQKLDWRVEE